MIDTQLPAHISSFSKAGLIDPSESILTTGSWIGDNALPWALMLQDLRPESPGKVIAIDPSELFIKDMIDLANVNGIGNLCAQVGILSKNVGLVALQGEYKTEHIKVVTEENLNLFAHDKPRLKASYRHRISSVSLDSLELAERISLLHLDVEGHEGELLEGAKETIASFRPIIITEGFDIWPDPVDENDKHVATVMKSLDYTLADVIPEYCGIKKNARNRIWWPDEKTQNAALAVVGDELKRPLVNWMSFDLPDV